MIDIHTHKPNPNSVYNLSLKEIYDASYPDRNQPLSVGLHPWWVTSDWEKDFRQVERWAQNTQVKWIGETGLDKIKGSSLSLQKQVFLAHIRLSETIGKPILVHCVKAIDEILQIKKETQPKQLWIFHGFRGKPQQMQQLLNAGFHISFGPKFNADSFLSCPVECRHLETDDSGLTPAEVQCLQNLK